MCGGYDGRMNVKISTLIKHAQDEVIKNLGLPPEYFERECQHGKKPMESCSICETNAQLRLQSQRIKKVNAAFSAISKLPPSQIPDLLTTYAGCLKAAERQPLADNIRNAILEIDDN